MGGGYPVREVGRVKAGGGARPPVHRTEMSSTGELLLRALLMEPVSLARLYSTTPTRFAPRGGWWVVSRYCGRLSVMRSVQTIVCGIDGKPIPNATVVLYKPVGIFHTDDGGSVVVPLEEAQTDVCVKVQDIAGYKTYLQSLLIPPRNVILGVGTPVGPSDIALPPLNPPSPPHDRRNVRAGFCNLHDSKGRPIFSPYFPCLPVEDQDDWMARWLHAGMTHAAIMIDDPVYPEVLPQYGTEYPAPHFAPTSAQFAAAATTLLTAGFTPIVFCTTGEYPSDLAAFEARLSEYCLPFAADAVFVEGWEMYATADQFRALYASMRKILGPSAILALHLPQGYVDDGAGDADWRDDGAFAEVDVFLMQLSPPYSAADIPRMAPGWLQDIQRVIPTPGVDYRFRNRTRPVTPVVFEMVAYPQIRGYITDTDIDIVMAWVQAQGIELLGNANHFP